MRLAMSSPALSHCAALTFASASVRLVYLVKTETSYEWPMLVDRRQSPRRRTLKRGRIVFDDNRSVLDCTVHNLSENGAQLRLPSAVGVPDTFELHVDGIVRFVWVVWTDKLGVTWIS